MATKKRSGATSITINNSEHYDKLVSCISSRNCARMAVLIQVVLVAASVVSLFGCTLIVFRELSWNETEVLKMFEISFRLNLGTGCINKADILAVYKSCVWFITAMVAGQILVQFWAVCKLYQATLSKVGSLKKALNAAQFWWKVNLVSLVIEYVLLIAVINAYDYGTVVFSLRIWSFYLVQGYKCELAKKGKASSHSLKQ